MYQIVSLYLCTSIEGFHIPDGERTPSEACFLAAHFRKLETLHKNVGRLNQFVFSVVSLSMPVLRTNAHTNAVTDRITLFIIKPMISIPIFPKQSRKYNNFLFTVMSPTILQDYKQILFPAHVHAQHPMPLGLYLACRHMHYTLNVLAYRMLSLMFYLLQ